GPYLVLGTGPYGMIPDHLLQKVWSSGGDMTKVKLSIAIPGGFNASDTMDKFIVGTGPFMFKEWVSGDHMTFVKNPNYWGSKPHLDQITIKFEPDTNTQLADLRTGTIDMGWDFRAALLSPLGHLSSGERSAALKSQPMSMEPVLRSASWVLVSGSNLIVIWSRCGLEPQ